MQRFKQQVDHLQQQLAGLTRPQKAFAIALAALMLVAVVWWVRHASSDEMIALFDEPVSALEAQMLTRALADRGIEHETRGDQLYVPSRRRGEAILAVGRALPADASQTLDQAIDKIGSFDVRQKIDARLDSARREELRQMIEGLPGVAAASVQLNTVYKRQIGESLLPSASVAIKSTGAADVHQMAYTVSCLLANSISGLEPERVTVVIDGRLVSGTDDDIRGARELHLRTEAEQDSVAKVREALGPIPGLVVSVAVEVRQSAAPASPSLANADIAPAAAGGVQLAPFGADRPLGLTDVVAVLAHRPGNASPTREPDVDAPPDVTTQSIPTGCSLVVPMSWMVRQWQTRNRTADLPSSDALREFEQARLQDLRSVAATALGGLAPELVSILVVADDTLAIQEDPGIVSDGLEHSAGISSLVRDWGRQVAVAALAAVGVLLVSSMLKKSAAVGGAINYSEPALALWGSEDLQELADFQGSDDPFLASEQLLQQARTMINEDPDAAAALISQWMASEPGHG